MFRRTMGGLVFIFGAGAASAQVPIPDAGSASIPLPVPTPPAVKATPAVVAPGALPQRTAAGSAARIHSAFEGPALPATQAPAATQAPGATPATPGIACTDLTCAPACPVPCCNPCYPQGRVWGSAEWLYWAAAGQSLPPLVTQSTTGGTGALVPGNTLLFGNQRVNNDFRNGLRINGGIWLDDCHKYGIEGDFLYLGDSSEGYAAGNNGAAGAPLVARPFFNVLTNLPDSELVAVPGALAGTVTVRAQNSIIGGGFNFRHNLCCNPCGRVDLVYGYRYFNVTDEVTITEDLLTTGGSPLIPAGIRFQIRDHFRAENSFNGGVIGLAAERQYSWLVVGVRAGVALGVNNQTVTIEGSTVRTLPGGAPTAFSGGLLAQGSNIGVYERSTFAVLPEFGLKLGVQLTDHVQIFAGYNFIYLSDVVRAGDQIDPRVNPNQLPPPNGLGGPAVPAFAFKTTDFWVQGVSAGLRLSY